MSYLSLLLLIITLIMDIQEPSIEELEDIKYVYLDKAASSISRMLGL